MINGGGRGTRTPATLLHVDGLAIRCITALPSLQHVADDTSKQRHECCQWQGETQGVWKYRVLDKLKPTLTF